MTNLEKLKNLLKSSQKKIAIISHKNPDGDAIGSSLAMYHYLNQLGHICNVIVPNDFPKFLKWLPSSKNIIIADYNNKKAQKTIHEAELIFILDFNTLTRIDQLGEWVNQSKKPKILIDHHRDPAIFDFIYSDISMPATCQMVYNFIEKMEDIGYIDKSIAECIYTGILTDTGGFRFRNTTSSTHRTVANLIEKGAEVDKINCQINDSQSPARLKLLALALNNLQLFPDYRTAFMYLKREDLINNGFQKGDTEGFVNYGLSVENYIFSVFFVEDTQNDFIKISFRSKGEFDVNQFSRDHFNGGGHLNAAGGKSDLSMKVTIEYFISRLDNYKEKLNSIKI